MDENKKNVKSDEVSNEFTLKQELVEKRQNIKSFDDLVEFLQHVKDNCNCGYGEAPRSIAQASLAVAWYLSNEFGITGFQAGCVMWDFLRDWHFRSNKCGLKLIDYDMMLYPQYDYRFEKTIHQTVWEELQKQAKENLKDKDSAHPDVVAHWESIAAGNVPFGYVVIND